MISTRWSHLTCVCRLLSPAAAAGQAVSAPILAGRETQGRFLGSVSFGVLVS